MGGCLTDGQLWQDAFYLICTSELKLCRGVDGINTNHMGVDPLKLIVMVDRNHIYSLLGAKCYSQFLEETRLRTIRLKKNNFELHFFSLGKSI